MRIVRFLGYPINHFSTLERMMLSQAVEMAKRGHHMEVVFDGVRNPEAAAAARAFAPGVVIHFDLPAPPARFDPAAWLRYGRAAGALIRRGRYDLVHLYFDPGARILNQWSRLLPGVTFLRTIGSTPVPRGGRRYLDGLKRRKWCFDLARMSRVVCVGEHIRVMLEGYGVAPRRLAVVPNATDIGRFRRSEPYLPAPLFRLVFVGRFNSAKNLPLLLRGMAALLAGPGAADVHLTLVGDGELRAALEDQVGQLQLAAHVTFAGQVADIPGLLNRQADLYVQASHNEGCPAAVIEAMACEVPVLLSDIDGHRQVAEAGVHATFFAAGDAADFARRVLQLKADRAGLRAQAQRARAHVVDTFSIDAWIGKECALYEALMAERGAAAA